MKKQEKTYNELHSDLYDRIIFDKNPITKNRNLKKLSLCEEKLDFFYKKIKYKTTSTGMEMIFQKEDLADLIRTMNEMNKLCSKLSVSHVFGNPGSNGTFDISKEEDRELAIRTFQKVINDISKEKKWSFNYKDRLENLYEEIWEKNCQKSMAASEFFQIKNYLEDMSNYAGECLVKASVSSIMIFFSQEKKREMNKNMENTLLCAMEAVNSINSICIKYGVPEIFEFSNGYEKLDYNDESDRNLVNVMVMQFFNSFSG